MGVLGDVSRGSVSYYLAGTFDDRRLSERIHEILECVMGDAMSYFLTFMLGMSLGSIFFKLAGDLGELSARREIEKRRRS